MIKLSKLELQFGSFYLLMNIPVSRNEDQHFLQNVLHLFFIFISRTRLNDFDYDDNLSIHRHFFVRPGRISIFYVHSSSAITTSVIRWSKA